MDLRSIYPSESNPSYTSDKSATLQFAVNAEGNLAASLEASWVTGEELDVEEQEEIQYSDNPLATGLLGQDVESVKGDVENIQVAKGSIEVGKIM
ncbi:hypothetical protein QCA50_012347 [Cerrena zonata]|uniref:Uncharacterized protein n=1 Tax=Cerrena zonata TaxID=2478898 RepID=A0AAW0G5W7_9APHY